MFIKYWNVIQTEFKFKTLLIVQNCFRYTDKNINNYQLHDLALNAYTQLCNVHW